MKDMIGCIEDGRTGTLNSLNMEVFNQLESGVTAALETFSNVHRGTGHFSTASTMLFEEARDIFIDHLCLNKKKYTAVFCSVRGADLFINSLKLKEYQILSSRDYGLPLGVRVVVVRKKNLPGGVPFQTGGEAIKDVSPDSVIWADAPHKFEAGTPGIINVITFARALKIIQKSGKDCFKNDSESFLTPSDILYDDELSGHSGLSLLMKLKNLLPGHDRRVPTVDGYKKYINFDNGAATPAFTPVMDTVFKMWRQSAEVQKEVIYEVRSILADFFNATSDDYEIIFTGNTTEAINVAADLIQNEYSESDETVILNTLMEHNSNELPWRYFPGADLIRLSVNSNGFISMTELEDTLKEYNKDGLYGRKRIRVVAVSGASNVLGTVNDIEKISRIAHKYDARIFIDAAQLAAHRSIDIEKTEIDYMVITGNKMYAPFGCGALIVRKKLLNIDENAISQIKTSGDENAAGIAALGKAVLLLDRIGMDVVENHEKKLTGYLLSRLTEIPEIEVFGIRDPEAENFTSKGGVVSFRFGNVPHNLAAWKISEFGGIGVRNGCFCAHLLVKHILKINSVRILAADAGLILKPGFTKPVLPGLVRVSFGIENDAAEIDVLVSVLKKIAAGRGSIITRFLASTGNGIPFLPESMIANEMAMFLRNCRERVYSVNTENAAEENYQFN